MCIHRIPHVNIQGTTCVYTGSHMCVYIRRVQRMHIQGPTCIQGTTCVYTGYHMCIYKVLHLYIQGTACMYSGCHMCIYKVPHGNTICNVDYQWNRCSDGLFCEHRAMEFTRL